MAFIRLLPVGPVSRVFLVALCAACGGDDDDGEAAAEAERMGPAGCYIAAELRCDCAIEEAGCTEEIGTWVEMGCGTCAM